MVDKEQNTTTENIPLLSTEIPVDDLRKAGLKFKEIPLDDLGNRRPLTISDIFYSLDKRMGKLEKQLNKKDSLKPGIQTSEFKVLIGSIITLIIGGLAGQVEPETVGIIGSLLTGFYTISRTLIKMFANKKK